MSRFLWICFAGALGTATRYLVGLGAAKWLGPAFPYGTLTVNLVGCFLISAVAYVAFTTKLVPPTLQFALTTGFMGGLTTYSSFNFETTKMLGDRAYGNAALYFTLTVGGCLVAGLLGVMTAKRIFGT
jgi:CrcB protein